MKLKLLNKIKETEDTISLRFSKNDNFHFKPGQFLTFILKDSEGELRRPYSISTSPNDKELEITIKKIFNGRATKILFNDVKEGDTLEALGPYGLFAYDNENVKKIVHIAAGSGIAPIRSIIRYIVRNKPEIKQTLLYSNKTPDEIIFKKELEKLPIECVFTVTRYEVGEWVGLIGRFNKETLKNYIWENTLYFICGPPLFVDSMASMLKELNVDAKAIRTERYG